MEALIRKIKLIPGYPVTHPIYGDVLVSLNEKPHHVAIRAFKGDWPIFIESAHFFGTLDWTVENVQCVDLEDACLKAKELVGIVGELKQRGADDKTFSDTINSWLRERS